MAMFDDYTLAEVKAMRKELAEAIATGAMQVKFADRTVQYRSLEEMRRTLALMDQAITAKNSGNPLRRILINSKKGFA